MKHTEFWRWWVISETTGKRIKSHHMTEAQARARYPGAERVAGSREIRELPETAAERMELAPGQHFVVQRGRTP